MIAWFCVVRSGANTVPECRQGFVTPCRGLSCEQPEYAFKAEWEGA